MIIPVPKESVPSTSGSTQMSNNSSSANHIIVDEKEIGIWDIIRLGNQGGVINLDGNYAIEVVKQNQKWCKIYLRQYGLGKQKEVQKFVPIKKVVEKVEVQRKAPAEPREAAQVQTKVTEKLAWD